MASVGERYPHTKGAWLSCLDTTQLGGPAADRDEDAPDQPRLLGLGVEPLELAGPALDVLRRGDPGLHHRAARGPGRSPLTGRSQSGVAGPAKGLQRQARRFEELGQPQPDRRIVAPRALVGLVALVELRDRSRRWRDPDHG